MSYWQRFWSLFRGFEESSSSAPKDDYYTVHTAVLWALPDDIDTICFSTVGAIDSAIARIAEIRAWSMTLEDPQVRRAYRSWLRYYEGQARRTKRDLLSGRREREAADYARKCEERDRRRADYERRNPVPRPPKEGKSSGFSGEGIS